LIVAILALSLANCPRGALHCSDSGGEFPTENLLTFAPNSSDADSDVLADYVIALLRHDQPVDEVRKLCDDQLEDFLKDGENLRTITV
jgi:hypothetical protein